MPGATATRERWLRFAPPLGAFLLARALFMLAAAWQGASPWQARTWAKWDSGHYLAIARSGYELFPCAPGSEYAAGTWCGNTAWFPGYSLLIRLVQPLFPSWEAAGAAVSAGAVLALLFSAWSMSRELKASVGARASALLALALFPGSVYFHAVFPVALVALASVTGARALSRERWGAAFAIGALGATAYSTGFLLAAPAGWVFIRSLWMRRRGARLWGPLLAAFGPVLGTLVVFAWQRAATGSWEAFFLVQAKYGYREMLPLESLWRVIQGLGARFSIVSLQTVFVAVLAVAASVGVLLRLDRRSIRLEELLAAGAFAFWIFPHLTGSKALSISRSEALVAPVALLLAHRSAPVRWGSVALCLLMAWRLAGLYFSGRLV